MTTYLRLGRLIAAAAVTTALAQPALAVPLLDGFGGPEGYGTLIMNPNDDGSSLSQNMVFPINFFGVQPSQFFVNNNGNITFNGPVSAYTPVPFPISGQPMIAPFWGDVDTRCGTCGAVYAAAPNADTLVVTWHNVGYYSSHSNRVNDFQLVLQNRADTGAGNFDVQFRYNRLEWTTGDASGGSGGLGGTPAQAGYDAGNLTNYFVLPGSRTGAVLDLVNTSNVSSGTPGLWSFAVRNGQLPGSAPDNPLLPVIQDGSFNFEFAVPAPGTRIFIDPVIAIGYDYVVNSGPLIATAMFPTITGDPDGYDLYGFNTVTGLYDIFLGHVNAGDIFDFGPSGISRFGLRDIEVGAGLDPNDPLAFVTGLTFLSGGIVNMSQTPVTLFVPDGRLPEPGTFYLFTAMLLGFAVVRRQQARRH